MKIYRDMNRIIGQNFFHTIFMGIGVPIMLWPFLSQPKGLGAVGGLMLMLTLMCCVGFFLYVAYVWLVHLWGMNKPTIEITSSGIRYPYLLRDSLEITWGQIKNFKYVEDYSGKHTNYYIVVELEDGFEIGPFKEKPGLTQQEKIQKKYDHRILVLFEDIIKDHSLPDLADRLNAERKILTRSPQFINNEPVLYEQRTEPLIEMLKRLGIEMVIGIAVVIYFFIYGAQNTQMRNYVLIFLGIVAFIIVMKFINHIKLLSAPTTALRFDEHGISIINDQTFTMPIAWENIQHVELRTKKQSPVLIIEAMDTESREVKSYEIKNDLQDTSVYEVMSSLKYYL